MTNRNSLTRRGFLKSLADITLGGAAASWGYSQSWAVESLIDGVSPRTFYLTSRFKSQQEQSVVRFVLSRGSWKVKEKIELPWDVHSIVASTSIKAPLVAIAQRPGKDMVFLDRDTLEIMERVNSGNEFRFYGHGQISKNGKYLFTSENDTKRNLGLIKVRELPSGKHLESFVSHGTGPHEVRLLDGDTKLLIAHGGDPHEDGDNSLNVDYRRDPSLVLMDLTNGKPLEKHPPKTESCSPRHLAVSPDGLVLVACQRKLSKVQSTPTQLLLAWRPGWTPVEIPLSPRHLSEMKHHSLSVAFNIKGTHFAVTSPLGDCVTIGESESLKFVRQIQIPNARGVAPLPEGDGWIVSSESGELWELSPHGAIRERKYLSFVERFLNSHPKFGSHVTCETLS